ncbi:hypothetical protein N9325_01140 [Alphaproteobacteria bacterium]|nr:hypothetical protein [Alphaproteobacteria bacterium]
MICLASIEKDVFSKFNSTNIPDNLIILLRNIVDEHGDDYNHITIADNKSNYVKRSLEKILSEIDNPSVQSILIEFLKLLKFQTAKPLINSESDNPGASKYVDFRLSYGKKNISNCIDFEDPNFETKIREYKKKYKITLSTSKYKNDINKCREIIEKIFLKSDQINFFRTSMGLQLLPFYDNKFHTINRNSESGLKNNFFLGLSQLFFITSLISKIKDEGIFLNKEKETSINIYTYQNKIKVFGRNDFEFDELSSSEILSKNLSIDESFKKILIKYKIKINFTIYMLTKNLNQSNSKILNEYKDIIHFRWLHSANGIFKFDAEKLADYKNGTLIKFYSFNVNKVGNPEEDASESLIFNNSEGLKRIFISFPN